MLAILAPSLEKRSLRSLRYLGLPYSGISDIGLMNAVNDLPGVLRRVEISECMNVGWDAVQMAEKSGVEITRRR